MHPILSREMFNTALETKGSRHRLWAQPPPLIESNLPNKPILKNSFGQSGPGVANIKRTTADPQLQLGDTTAVRFERDGQEGGRG